MSIALTKRRLGLLAALVCGLLPLLPAVAAPPKAETFTGQVKPLAGVLDKLDARLDADASPSWLALVGDDGKALPLIKDAGSRMFFKDKRLLDRPMKVTGRVLPEVGLLQVLQVRSVKDGKVHDLYYWCDVCSIRRLEPMICECCGGPMDLHEDPLER